MQLDAETRARLLCLRDALSTRSRVTVLTGAGVSSASGVPTFRGAPDSLWENHRPQDLATPEAFARDPQLVWRWYDWRRVLIAGCQPNAAHLALARLEDSVAAVTVITQNVDGLHARAGSRRVIEFHGSIWRVRCTGCGHETVDTRAPLPPPLPPSCPACGAALRPGVIWFTETIDPEAMQAASSAARDCDLFLVVGTSGVVWPAAGLAGLARASGAQVVEFNLEPGGIRDQVHLFVPGDAALTVPLIVP